MATLPIVKRSYRERLLALLDYMDEHPQDDLTLANLSQRACLSSFHFHRQFSAVVGMTPGQYRRASNFRCAAKLLAFRSISITDLAFNQGYESLEAFSRAFKDYTGQSPNEFRKAPDWKAWQNMDQTFIQLRKKHMQTSTNYSIELRQLPDINLAILEHKGPEYLLGKTIQEFIAWRKQNQLPPSRNRTFNLIYEDPASVAADDFRMQLAVEIKGDYPKEMGRLLACTIPKGTYVSLLHRGNDQGLEAAVQYLYKDWLSASNYELRDFPLLFERVTFFPDVPEHQAETRIYLPLAD